MCSEVQFEISITGAVGAEYGVGVIPTERALLVPGSNVQSHYEIYVSHWTFGTLQFFHDQNLPTLLGKRLAVQLSSSHLHSFRVPLFLCVN